MARHGESLSNNINPKTKEAVLLGNDAEGYGGQ